MKHDFNSIEDKIQLEYFWQINKNWQKIKISANEKEKEIEENSEAEFIKEHYFGYTKVNENKTFEYEVQHPRWKQYKVLDFEIKVDFKAAYGEEFDFLNQEKPTSIIFAKGSEITVKNKILI